MINEENTSEKVNTEEPERKSYFDRHETRRKIIEVKPEKYKMFVAYRYIYVSLMIVLMVFDKIAQYVLTQKYGLYVVKEALFKDAKIAEGLIWVFIFSIPITMVIYLKTKKESVSREEFLYYLISIVIDGAKIIVAMGIISLIFAVL